MTKTFTVWSEGYSCTGQHSGAQNHGEWQGETFADACQAWADSTSNPELFVREQLTYWGCRLFDNETDARKAFG